VRTPIAVALAAGPLATHGVDFPNGRVRSR